jgi:cytosine deaminase
MLRQKGVQVDILEDSYCIALFAKYMREKPEQNVEDCNGLAEVRKAAAGKS